MVKSYDQQCPLAMALDHVGDRWSLLLIRELLGGPARYNDLLLALPGIASNLLSTRLRRLEESGVVTRQTVFGSNAYALTPLGADLRPALDALGIWGAAVGPVRSSSPQPLRSARSVAMGLQAILQLADPPDAPIVIDLAVDDDHLTIIVGGNKPATVTHGSPPRSDRQASTSLEVLSALTINGLPPHGISEADDTLTHLLATAIERMRS